MSGLTSQEALFSRIRACELEHHVCEIEVEGVPIWDLIRFDVCLEQLLVQVGLGKSWKMAPGSGRLQRLERRARKMRHNRSLDLTPFQGGPMVVGSGRRKKEADGCWWDPVWDPIAAVLSRPALYLQMAMEDRMWDPIPGGEAYYLDGHVLRALIQRGPTPSIPPDTLERLTAFGAALEEAVGVPVDVAGTARAFLQRHLARRRSFGALLDRLQPSVLFMTVGYGMEYMIEAARTREIPIVELQHGTIHACHPAYHYPDGLFKRLLPDYFLSYGPAWTEEVALPYREEQVGIVGYPYFERQLAALRSREKKRQVVVISQGVVGEALTRFAVGLRQHLPSEVPVVLKLHPGEYAGWQGAYPWLAGSGVDVLADDTGSLLVLQAESLVQVGCYSTALYEGVALGCRTYCVEAPGVEVMGPLLGSGAAEQVTRPDQVELLPGNPQDTTVFFATRWQDNMEQCFERFGLKDRVK